MQMTMRACIIEDEGSDDGFTDDMTPAPNMTAPTMVLKMALMDDSLADGSIAQMTTPARMMGPSILYKQEFARGTFAP
jgi:hypothetical protein